MIKMAYIATPYSDPNDQVHQLRYHQACWAAKELKHDFIVYSPIAHWHPIAVSEGMPTDAEFWKTQNEGMMQRCDVIIVIQFEGWVGSKGVAMEIKYAKENNKELIYINPIQWETV